MTLKKLFSQVAFILIVSLVLGIGVNFSLVKKYLRGDFQHGFFSQYEYPSVAFITLAEAEDYFFGGEAMFIDSRPYVMFQAGRILNAANIPYESEDIESVLDGLAIPKEKTLVIYCDGDECQSSVHLAKLLHQRGYSSLKVFFGGWAEWKESGLPIQVQND